MLSGREYLRLPILQMCGLCILKYWQTRTNPVTSSYRTVRIHALKVNVFLYFRGYIAYTPLVGSTLGIILAFCSLLFAFAATSDRPRKPF